jgi:hypothetical protein
MLLVSEIRPESVFPGELGLQVTDLHHETLAFVFVLSTELIKILFVSMSYEITAPEGK